MTTALAAVERYVVEFYNPVSHMIHSSVTVEVAAKDAVKRAIELVAQHYGEDVSSHRAALKYAATGEGVPGLENIATKAQLSAQVEQLMRQIRALEDDGSTPEYAHQVRSTLPNPNPHVAPPPVFNEGVSGGIKPPDAGSFRPGAEFSQPPATTGVSQADIDAAVAQRQAEAGPAI